MTVSSTTTSVTYAGNGSTTAFSVTFPFYELEVVAIDADGVETLKTETTHYTLSGGDGSTGTVTMLTAPASGTTLRLQRATLLTQTIAFSDTGPFPADDVNEALDRAAMRDQDLQAQLDANPYFNTSAESDVMDMRGQVVSNMADGVEDTDGATVGQLEALALSAGAGNVLGPSIAPADGDIAEFDGVTGRLLKSGGGSFTANFASRLGAETDVASASTLDLTAVTTFRVRITGGTTITTVTTVPNRVHLLRFAAALYLTNTTSWLPGGSTFSPQVMEAGDQLLIASDSSGAWTVVAYHRFNGGRARHGESTVASAATTNISALAYDRVNITGTTTITSFGTWSRHNVVWVRFSGILTLTYNATSLILPTGASITTAAGDTALFQADSSNNWRCLAYQRASGAALTSSGSATTGVHNVWIPATAMTPSTTNGPAWGSVEMTTNKEMFSTLDFDTTTAESAWFSLRMPKSWNESTITFEPVWSHAATSTNFGVVFSLAGIALSDDDAGDTAVGTVQTSTDTGGTTNDIYIGPTSSAITIAGTPAAQDLVFFKIARVPSDGSDTMAIDARLHGITLNITTDADTDA